MNFLNWWSDSPWLGCMLLIFICAVLEGFVKLVKFMVKSLDS